MVLTHVVDPIALGGKLCTEILQAYACLHSGVGSNSRGTGVASLGCLQGLDPKHFVVFIVEIHDVSTCKESGSRESVSPRKYVA